MMFVEIEATNQCNTHCIHCPREAITRPIGMMSWEAFEIIADKILTQPVISSIDFAGMGEPLLNPLLSRFIAQVSSYAPTYITTNASVLSPVKITQLLESGLQNVIVSLSGHNDALFRSMSGGLALQKVEAQVRQLVASATEQMAVLANVSLTLQTTPYVMEIKNYLNSLGIESIFFSKCHNRGGYLNDSQICDTPVPPKGAGRCDIFANTLFVAWTGEVLACCHDLEGKGQIGNLVTEDIDVILERKRNIIQNGVKFPMCENCNDIYRFSQDATPDNSPLAEWIYSLYANEDARAVKLIETIRQRDARIYDLEQREKALKEEVAGFKNGRLMRLLLGLQNWLRKPG